MTYYKVFQYIHKQLSNGYSLKSCSHIFRHSNTNSRYLQPSYFRRLIESNAFPYNEHNYRRIPLYKSNLLEMHLIHWKKGSSTPIHEHPSNGCIMKIIKGTLIEIQHNHHKAVGCTLYNQNVKFIPSSPIKHTIYNKSNIDAYSIHIYSPPYSVHQKK